MILWTIQEECVYRQILETGVYRCDFSLSSMPEWQAEYDWLVGQMKKRIGMPPEGVTYPVWAWYRHDGKRRKPDLRRERWGYGLKGDIYVCMEIDVPDQDVLLSDFDAWSIILLHGLLSDTEEEDERLNSQYEALSASEQVLMKEKNWERAFDLTPMDNEWMRRGDTIQATFWELKKEYIKKVRFFTAASNIPSRPNDERVRTNQ